MHLISELARKATAPAEFSRNGYFCNTVGLDLSVGCEHACRYCYFERLQALQTKRKFGKLATQSLSIDWLLDSDDLPQEIYLSPMTDPLARNARKNLVRLLQHVLPRGIRVAISTKGIVSREVFRLLAAHPQQVRLGVGVTSLDEHRNAVVEPGCPSAQARLANLRLAREYGLTKVSVRIDPLLPGIDDREDGLSALLDRIAEQSAQAVTASYLFVRSESERRRLSAFEYLGDAAAKCRDLCPTSSATSPFSGSVTENVISVSLAEKRRMFQWFHRECQCRGLLFGTCGCKDLRLQSESFPTACSIPDRTTCEPEFTYKLPILGD